MNQDIVMTIIATALDFLYDNDQYLISIMSANDLSLINWGAICLN